MTNKKGFTLIELLAVISILAIVALITAPIIVNTISRSKESANTVSATNYIRAVDTTLKTESIDKISVEDGYYEIATDGSVCLNELKNGKCIGERLKITANGNKPIKGNVTIEDEEVARATIVFNEFTVDIAYDGKIKYRPFALEYELGQPIHILSEGESVNDGTKWYVIDEDVDTVTLLFSNPVSSSEWIKSSDFDKYKQTNDTCTNKLCSYIGPVTLTNILNQKISQFDIPVIDDYEYINNSSSENKYQYQKYTIKNGVTTYTDYAGNKITIPGKTKARLLSAKEILEIASIYNLNLTHENLKEYLNSKFDILSTSFEYIVGEVQSLEEIFEAFGMEDNWVTAYFFTLLLNLELDASDLINFKIPKWLSAGDDEDSVYTSTSISFGSNYSDPLNFLFQTINVEVDEQVFSFLFGSEKISSELVVPVIKIRKDDKRIQQ